MLYSNLRSDFITITEHLEMVGKGWYGITKGSKLACL
jgi:hypothetical protein